jgi:stage III sporulation protein AB
VEETWPNTAMGVPEREVMIDFGKTLGLSDRQDQLQHLKMAIANLKVEENHARDEQVRYEKMCKTLGFLAGALLVILMI